MSHSGNVIAVALGKVADKFALRPAVAFAEGMQRVQFAEIMGRTVTERGGIKPGKARRIAVRSSSGH